MLSFIFPDILWLLLLIPLLWGFTLVLPRRLAAWRTWGSLLLRTLGIAALVLALAGTQFIQPVQDLQVVFLLDSSDSVALSQRARAETYVQDALNELSPDDRAGIVVFGGRALVERPPDDERVLGQLIQSPPGTRTNIQDALQLGLGLLPAESQRRLVLLSDGGENSGDAMEAVRLAAAQGVPVDVVSLSGVADGLDVQISGLELPATASEGQRLRLVVELYSRGPATTLPTTARLLVEQRQGMAAMQSAQILADDAIELTGGSQRFELVLPPPQDRFTRYVVQVQVADDVRRENNIAEAFTLVEGRPRVLLVEGTPDAARNLSAALASVDLATETVTPDRVPASLSDLVAYDAIVLVDVPERLLNPRAAAILPEYVRELGRGLAMIGGTQSFGAGGWRNTPLEQALPVDMDLRPESSQPPVSIVIVIDVSGSMAAIDEGGEQTKIELAATGAARIAEQLRDDDEITVIPFDSQAQGIVGPLPGSEREQAIDRIMRIDAGGGGINIYDALQRAAGFIRSSSNPVKHIITITDGSDTVQQEGARDLIDQLRSDGVTVSSIAVGDGKDVVFLEDVVRRGNGRFFLTRQAREIPDIMTIEAQSVIMPLVIEEDFVPRLAVPHAILRDVGATPPLHGYVATTPKESTQVLLVSDRDDPLLAVWQYGLGRSLAWTSDMRGQWASDWVRWQEYQQIAARMITWLLPSPNEQRLALETRIIADQVLLVAHARSDDGGPATGQRVAGQMIDGKGQTIDVALREVTPGEYRLAVQDVPPGVYLVQLVATDAQGQAQASVMGGASIPFSSEYRSQGDNPALLDNIASLTGGRVNPDPAAVYAHTGQQSGLVREAAMPLVWLAVLLLPFDVAMRRLFWHRRTTAFMRRQPRSEQAERKKKVVEPDSQPVVRSAPPADDALERMREAQERARKRARGEE